MPAGRFTITVSSLLHKSALATVLCVVSSLITQVPVAGGAEAAPPKDASATKSAFQRRGFYLHGCWKYNYPFAVRSWKPADYHDMFLLLRQLGFNTVMMWPVLEAVPMPLSDADREAVRTFRPIIEDARQCGLETWLTLCIETCGPEIAVKPWLERSLYSHRKTVRLDDPKVSAAYLQHRSALLKILNNADGYVTIDGDPGGYHWVAKPSDYLKVLMNDRKALDRVGTHPRTQKIIPWIWSGWGRDTTSRGFWVEPMAPFVAAELEAFKRQQRRSEPWELLPGRESLRGMGQWSDND